MRPARLLTTFLLTAAFSGSVAFAQQEQPASGHAHHGGHRISQDARLTYELFPAPEGDGGRLVMRLGPLNLPADTDHTEAEQAPDFYVELPFEGWITGYAPRLISGSYDAIPGRLLHHVALWNTERSDFLCPNKEEHIFGAGGEMNQWPVLPGIGYPVQLGERLRVNTMFHNPTDTDHPDAYLEITIEYRGPEAGLRSVYPAWFDAGGCGASGYDLPPGPSEKSGRVTLKFSGILVGVGGHVHDHAEELVLSSGAQGELARLAPVKDYEGHISSMPIVDFMARGGLRLGRGERITTTAVYDNKTNDHLTEGAMGIVVGYFLPDPGEDMAVLRRPRRKEEAHVHP